MKKYYSIGAVLVLLCFAASAMFAQATASSSLAGTITDQTGAVVVGASVTATETATGSSRTATTGATGDYRFDLLPPGMYTVSATKSGFGKAAANSVELFVSKTTTQNFTMQPGAESQTVEVTGEAPLLDQQQTSVGLDITPEKVENLPLNGRDFANLAYLAPGAKATAPWDPTKVRTSGVAINGSNGRNMNITINGVDDKDNTVGGPVMQLPLEAVQEAVFSTQRFSAANGRSEGAAMNVITRSGSNSYHGSAYYFDTRTALNANDFFNKGNPTPQFDRWQFGGRFGGPIRKDKDFAFFAWERLIEHTAIPVLPSAFSELSLVKGLNLGNVTFAAQPATTIPTPYKDTRYNGRIDHNFSSNHRFFVSISGQQNTDLNDQSGNANDLSEGNFQTNALFAGNATLNSVFTPRLVNALTLGWQYWNNLIDSKVRAPLVTFPQGISFGTNGNVPQQSYQKKYQFKDDVSYTVGNHSHKFGVDYLWEPKLGGYFEFNSTLEYDFQDVPSVILSNKTLYPQGFQTPGAVQGISISNGDPAEDLPGGGKMLGLYYQDTWKATHRLTLDLGMRYDRDFNLMATSAQAGSRTYLLLKAINSPYAGVPKDYKKGFSPRVGFTYDLTGSGNNIVRGGYGLYFGQTFLNIPLFMIQQANPTLFATSLSLGAGEVVPGSGGKVLGTGPTDPTGYRLGIDPLPTIPPPHTQLAAGDVGRLMEPHYRNPYSQQFNVGFAHSFNASTVGEIEYVHELGLHEEKRSFLNYVDYTLGPCTAPTLANPASCNTSTRTLKSALAAAGQPQIARVSMETSWGRSRYDGLNVTFRRRMSNRFSLNSTYTLSEGWAYNGNAASYSSPESDPRNPMLPADFGPVPNDERHHWSTSLVIDLPWGFQVAPIMQVASARPYNATVGISNLLFGSGVSAAKAIVPTSNLNDINYVNELTTQYTSQGFGSKALTATTNYLRYCYLVSGSCTQKHFDALRGQPYFDLDSRVTKTIKLGEQRDLKLMFQGFDLTNRANFGANYDGNLRSKTFGQPLGFATCGGNGCNTAIPISFRAEFGAQFTF